jgi:hypothetical protein
MKKLTQMSNNGQARLCCFSLVSFSVFSPFSSAFAQSRKINRTFSHENCALLGHYAASSDHFLPTFQDNLSVPPSCFLFLTLEDGIDVPKRLQGITINCCVTAQNSAVLIYFATAACPSVRPSVCVHQAATTGRTSTKF